VLDNCEHLLQACAALAHAVLRGCPATKILVTSLQPLGLPHERVYALPPLSLPDDEHSLAQSDAARLFVQRAEAALPEFTLGSDNTEAVAMICRRLDGMPLALELAAARARLLSADQIARRLDNVFGLLTRGSTSPLPRHQTLRATMDWSYRLLTPAEQSLLRRLSVFAGAFTVEMAEAVCGEGEAAPPAAETPPVVETLFDLADKSLIRMHAPAAQGGARIRLLETVRQYAREKLEESGEATRVRDRYLNWCVDWAEPAAKHLTAQSRADWLAQFTSRQEHFRAALRWACTNRQVEAGLRLAVALGSYWLTAGLSEGQTWLEELLVLAGEQAPDAPSVPDLVRGWALFYSGRLAERQGDAAHGRRRGEASLTMFQAAADIPGCLAALNLLALAAQDSNDYRRAEACYDEGLTLSRQARNERMTAVLLVNQGLMYYEQQDYRRVAPIWDEASAIIERLGDPSIALHDNLACLAMMEGRLGQAQALLEHELHDRAQAGNARGLAVLAMDLGEVARRQGDLERADTCLRQALEQFQQVGDLAHIGETLANLGSLARNRGDLKTSKFQYEQSLACLEKVAYSRPTSEVKTNLGLLATAQGRDEEALTFFREGLRAALEGQHHLSRVEALEGMAGILARRGDAQRAARWLAVTDSARETLGAPIPPVEQARYNQIVQQLQQTLGAARYAILRAEAGRLSLEQLESEALETPSSEAPPRVAVPSAASSGLRVLALGSTRVQVGQRELAQSDWTYAKSRELLFYLLTHGPASKAQIGLDLWPDVSPGQLRASFHSALHHLRRALGRPEWIIHAGGEYSLNSDLALDYDVRTFEQLLRQAQRASQAAPPAGRTGPITHLEAAIALWRGDFLADIEAGDWAVFQREALRQAFLDSLLQLADLHFAEAHYPAAMQAYRQALSLDSYLELAHRGLMRCYARQGEAGRAVRHYHDLSQLLRQDLSTAPSTESTLLYDRIRRGDDI